MADEPTSNVIPFPDRPRLSSVPRLGRYQAVLDLFGGRNDAAIELNDAAARHLAMLNRELR